VGGIELVRSVFAGLGVSGVSTEVADGILTAATTRRLNLIADGVAILVCS
jgi:hypothetical protein